MALFSETKPIVTVLVEDDCLDIMKNTPPKYIKRHLGGELILYQM